MDAQGNNVVIDDMSITGGIHVVGGNVEVHDSTISNGHAAQGGGIYLANGNMEINRRPSPEQHRPARGVEVQLPAVIWRSTTPSSPATWPWDPAASQPSAAPFTQQGATSRSTTRRSTVTWQSASPVNQGEMGVMHLEEDCSSPARTWRSTTRRFPATKHSAATEVTVRPAPRAGSPDRMAGTGATALAAASTSALPRS